MPQYNSIGTPSSSVPPNYNYDCAISLCSEDCPLYCSPPPPPLFLNPNHGRHSSHISPPLAALIAVFSAAFLLFLYFTFISKFFRRESPPNPTRPRPLPTTSRGFIRQITAFKFRRGDTLYGTECAICLAEFKEDETLRLLPSCEHAFHLPCIDTWLQTHSTCPLCRSTMNPV